MSLPWFAALPAWAVLPDLLAHLAAGILLGAVYFLGVWHSARRLADGAPAMPTILLIAGRFVLLGGLLTLASLEGALPLLAAALGVLVARPLVMRRVREAAP